jgi:hypothetical protein
MELYTRRLHLTTASTEAGNSAALDCHAIMRSVWREIDE